MIMSRILTLSFATVLVWASLGLTQDTPRPKDEALDNLLEKLDEARSPDPAKPAPENKEDKENKEKKEGPEAPPAPKPAKPADAPAEKGKAEVESKDQALDNLLEKLGETKDAPGPDDRP